MGTEQKSPFRAAAAGVVYLVGAFVPYLLVFEAYRQAGFTADRLTALAVATAVALAGHLLLQVIGSALAGLRPATVELGVGRIVREYASPLGIIYVRWLPLRLTFDCWATSLRSLRLRFWFPHALACFGLLTAFAIAATHTAITGDGPSQLSAGWLATLVVSAAGLLALVVPLPFSRDLQSSGQRLYSLPSSDPARLRARCAPYIDARVRRLNTTFRRALSRNDGPAAQSALDELSGIPAGSPLLPGWRTMTLVVNGEFAAAAYLAYKELADGTVLTETARSNLATSVLSAWEAEQPLDIELVIAAREVIRGENTWPADYQALLESWLALYDNDLEQSIEWGERCLRWSTSRAIDCNALLTMAQAYAWLGWRRDAERALARAAKLDREPRIPHVTRRVAAALAQPAPAQPSAADIG